LYVDSVAELLQLFRMLPVDFPDADVHCEQTLGVAQHLSDASFAVSSVEAVPAL
jgi:hypothetical protein